MAPKSRYLKSVNHKIVTWNTNRPRRLYFTIFFNLPFLYLPIFSLNCICCHLFSADNISVFTYNFIHMMMAYRIAPAPIDAWWRSCNISYSFGTFAEMLGCLPNLSGFKIADRYLLWPVPKLKIDRSRRNASTRSYLVERYQHYAIAFFVKQLYYSFFSMNKCDHKLHNNKHSINYRHIWVWLLWVWYTI
jgi:hypothetical protein